jgi:acetylornithine deacetylase/succinyl-diaminopimelate desuccinylase-like protein
MSVDTRPDFERFLLDRQGDHHAELFELLRIPSISTRTEYAPDVVRTAEWVRAALERIGLTARVHTTPGHPIVVGEWRDAPDAPTVLIYGHYDVQPPEPLDLWQSPPFEPELRDGRIYARGAMDDKGQVFLHMKALEAHLVVRGALPVNIVLVIEGEEEIGSPNLLQFIRDNTDMLAADATVISDSAMFAPGLPTILASLRGVAYLQVDAHGPATDLHSGSYGGAVVNPATELARLLGSLHDDNGHVAVDGFYDRVSEWDPDVIAQMRELPFEDDGLRAETGAPALGGESGFTTLERLWTRPTCDVHGLLAGYTGDGAKTVLPSTAMAKLSCRLVPDQNPEEIHRLIEQHLLGRVSPGVTLKVTHLNGSRPWRADVRGPLLNAAQRALASVFPKAPVIVGEGGSLPVVTEFAKTLGTPVLLVGFGLPGHNAHAPNEWIAEENIFLGARAMAALWDEYATEGKAR